MLIPVAGPRLRCMFWSKRLDVDERVTAIPQTPLTPDGFGAWAIVHTSDRCSGWIALEPSGRRRGRLTWMVADPGDAAEAAWMGLTYAFDVVGLGVVTFEGILGLEDDVLTSEQWVTDDVQERRRAGLGVPLQTCPVCTALVSPTQLRAALTRIERLRALPAVERGNAARWACLACIAAQRALVANPACQTSLPSMGPATCALYVDEVKRCRDCGAAFTFGRFEQRVWYERYHIPLDVVRIRCGDCTVRYQAGKRISARLASPSNTAEDAVALAEDYAKLGNTARHNYWRKRAAALQAGPRKRS